MYIIIHFYNQRGEDSENRIKELKNDFGARQMPCILSYNLKPLHE
ncbi:IS1380-Spn1, transposase [uncultured Gammaproteobacteria bacterium]|nr:IS1380-Spn1, transposase [uncultured Gammaproteobacteria bacterium]